MTVKTVRKRRTDRVGRDEATSLRYKAGRSGSTIGVEKAVSLPKGRIGLRESDGGRAGQQMGRPIGGGYQGLLCGVDGVP